MGWEMGVEAEKVTENEVSVNPSASVRLSHRRAERLLGIHEGNKHGFQPSNKPRDQGVGTTIGDGGWQGEAIAHNLRDMFGLRVPSMSIVIGEGGSGGALAIGCCNKMLMLENAVYFVAR